jgi:hypothetical protein
MKGLLSDNGGFVSCGANDGWITGNIVFDRDIFGFKSREFFDIPDGGPESQPVQVKF